MVQNKVNSCVVAISSTNLSHNVVRDRREPDQSIIYLDSSVFRVLNGAIDAWHSVPAVNDVQADGHVCIRSYRAHPVPNADPSAIK